MPQISEEPWVQTVATRRSDHRDLVYPDVSRRRLTGGNDLLRERDEHGHRAGKETRDGRISDIVVPSRPVLIAAYRHWLGT